MVGEPYIVSMSVLLKYEGILLYSYSFFILIIYLHRYSVHFIILLVGEVHATMLKQKNINFQFAVKMDNWWTI